MRWLVLTCCTMTRYCQTNHLQPAVALAIATKRRIQTRRSWRLDPWIPYDKICTSLDTVVDGSWGFLSGSTSLTYLIQCYEFQGQPWVSIFLYSSATAMSSWIKLGHQVDAELGAFSCAVTDVEKSVRALKDLNFKLEGGPILISDSQTCISLCVRPSSTLDLSTSLIDSAGILHTHQMCTLPPARYLSRKWSFSQDIGHNWWVWFQMNLTLQVGYCLKY